MIRLILLLSVVACVCGNRQMWMEKIRRSENVCSNKFTGSTDLKKLTAIFRKRAWRNMSPVKSEADKCMLSCVLEEFGIVRDGELRKSQLWLVQELILKEAGSSPNNRRCNDRINNCLTLDGRSDCSRVDKRFVCYVKTLVECLKPRCDDD